MYIKRHLEEQILKASSSFPVVMLTGARQTGKTTMLLHIKEDNRKYVSLKDRAVRSLAQKDPALFFQQFGECLIIDEFQEVPQLLDEIFSIIEKRKVAGENYKGLFWLTGSQKFKMLDGVMQSLTGRVAIFEMLGLSRQEIKGEELFLFSGDTNVLKQRAENSNTIKVNDLFEDIFAGSMPDVIANKLDRNLYYQSYVATYLERDIKDLLSKGSLNKFYDFLVCIASRISCELKYEEIANEVGVSSPTIKTWVSILERSGIVYLLHPYYNNVIKRLIKTPKIYFTDTGLASYLTSWPTALTIQDGNMSGRYFENYVVMEIIKSYINSAKPQNIFYYRDLDKREMDLLLQQGDNFYPIEIKKAAFPTNADKNYTALEKLGKVHPLIVLCMTETFVPLNKNTYLCPLSVL